MSIESTLTAREILLILIFHNLQKLMFAYLMMTHISRGLLYGYPTFSWDSRMLCG